MTDAASPDRLPTDLQGHIDDDAPCLGCGYNLRGLDSGGACPECGVAIGRSVHGNLLRYASPGWVEQLVSGMNWIVAAIVLSVVLGGVMGNGSGQVTLVDLVVAVVSLVGYWKVTEPEPGRVEHEPQWSPRFLTRWTSVALVGIRGADLVLLQLGPGAVLGSLLAEAVVAVVGTFATGYYAMSLASRLPDARLERQTHIVMWGMAIMGGLISLAVATLTAAEWGGAALAALEPWMTAAAVVVGLAWLVLLIWTLVLVVDYRSRFQKAARWARRTWATQADAHAEPDPLLNDNAAGGR